MGISSHNHFVDWGERDVRTYKMLVRGPYSMSQILLEFIQNLKVSLDCDISLLNSPASTLYSVHFSSQSFVSKSQSIISENEAFRIESKQGFEGFKVVHVCWIFVQRLKIYLY